MDRMQILPPWLFSIDRTTGEFGTCCCNSLTLGIVHERYPFPALWWMLEKIENSDSDEHIRILEAFIKLFPTAAMRYLCSNHEFAGQRWLRYLLLEPAMPFRLRI
ncbi:MAG: hypothetical protein ACFB0E_17500 [Leptolyngbyaceae cyanobacterium]